MSSYAVLFLIMDENKVYKSPRTGRRYADYREYIESASWSEIRLRRIKLDRFTCQMCGTAKNLVVHHITYDRLGHEDINDLITLCHDCHEKVHGLDIAKKKKREEVFEKPRKKKRKRSKCKTKKKANTELG